MPSELSFCTNPISFWELPMIQDDDAVPVVETSIVSERMEDFMDDWGSP